MINETARILIKKNSDEKSKMPFVCQTQWKITYPNYQEKKIKEVWKIIKKILNSFFIYAKIDLAAGFVLISTTEYTRDPFVLFNARDFVRLISRSVPVNQAVKIFDEGISCEILKISNFTRNKKEFLKRRKRLIGINGSTIRAVEMITKTYILVQGNSVSCMGQHSGIKQARKIIHDCMLNIHPVFHIKILMIKQELSKDCKVEKENWDCYIPSLKSKHNIKSNNSKEIKPIKGQIIRKKSSRLHSLIEDKKSIDNFSIRSKLYDTQIALKSIDMKPKALV